MNFGEQLESSGHEVSNLEIKISLLRGLTRNFDINLEEFMDSNY